MEFSTEELQEMNDALAEVMHRMVNQGQTKAEIEYGSLAVMWQLNKKIVRAILGSDDTPGIHNKTLAIEEAIKNPKRLNREHAYI